MLGCRALTAVEIDAVAAELEHRDKALFILGCRTGFRISELLSLQLKDVKQGERMKEQITVTKQNMKGKTHSRTIYVQMEARIALDDYINGNQHVHEQAYLFCSRKNWNKPMSRVQAYRILKAAFNLCGMQGTFAWMIWEGSLNNLAVTSSAMGHKNVNSTMSYIDINRGVVTTLLKALEQ